MSRETNSHKRPINGPGGIRGKADGPPGPHIKSPVDPYLPRQATDPCPCCRMTMNDCTGECGILERAR